MPGSHPPVTLRLERHTLPAVRAALEEAIAEVRAHVERLGRIAFIPEPWLGDRISREAQSYYNSAVMEARDGPYAALTKYLAELIAIHGNVQVLEEQYLRAEDENAGLARRL